jgi:large subunit ribosomal protein L25
MKTAQLSGSIRTNVGKKDATALRNAELVPCVLYGQGEQTHFAVKRNDIEKIVFSPDVYQVELELMMQNRYELVCQFA